MPRGAPPRASVVLLLLILAEIEGSRIVPSKTRIRRGVAFEILSRIFDAGSLQGQNWPVTHPMKACRGSGPRGTIAEDG